MGNYLPRKCRWQQDTRKIPWNPRIQNPKVETSRCWCLHVAEGCFCLPWKKIHIFKARQDSPKENEGMPAVPTQEDGDQTSAGELCYTLINHRGIRRRPSVNFAEEYYENISLPAERPSESLRGTETDYAVLHVPLTPRNPPSTEAEYELLMPGRIYSHFLQKPRPLMPPSETRFSHL
ncbi:germinal center-associated signaling and motility protein [Trichechus manatus latirostris]|uniref:Germinal center-associated signaling and motility protein n=1 Tax=Trichechus manatus latirostris TaxID=127582 RepID=A0A2Y9DG13_TRIMA|nr:germinal center-associated signaling and motility protein [Trichechus manatus latirostris]